MFPSETTPARQSRGEIRASVRFCGTGRDGLSDAGKLLALMRKGETPGQAIKRIVLEAWERERNQKIALKLPRRWPY